MKTGICALTCDRPELVRQSLAVLAEGAQNDKYDLFVADGSRTKPGEETVFEIGYPTATIHSNICGGAGAGIVYALTLMLNHKDQYDVVGLCEADVLLGDDWFDRTVQLFERGRDDGLDVGAVSARCYEDRILFQRDGYAVCHNLGAGMVLFTRQAARLVLDNFRTGWTSDNRRIFAQLAGIDIGAFWAFRTNEHFLTADWWWDAVLAAHGLASLALTPSPVEMIGQNPPLAEQGLKIVESALDMPFVDKASFGIYRGELARIREGALKLGTETQFHFDSNTGTWTYFPHQMHMLGGRYEGDWRLQEARGWGTFAWRAGDGHTSHYMVDGSMQHFVARLNIFIFGPCSILVSGGKIGGRVEVIDEHSGFKAAPELIPEGENGAILQLQVPGAMQYRNIRIIALTPGVVFYGIQTREKQPCVPNAGFDYSNLPPV